MHAFTATYSTLNLQIKHPYNLVKQTQTIKIYYEHLL